MDGNGVYQDLTLVSSDNRIAYNYRCPMKVVDCPHDKGKLVGRGENIPWLACAVLCPAIGS